MPHTFIKVSARRNSGLPISMRYVDTRAHARRVVAGWEEIATQPAERLFHVTYSNGNLTQLWNPGNFIRGEGVPLAEVKN